MQKINARWQYGVFIGVRRRSGEIYVATEDGTIKCARTVRRIPESERWDMMALSWVKAVPWNLGKTDDSADGDIPEFDDKHGPGVKMSPEEVGKFEAMKTERCPRSYYLTKADFEKHDYTDRCGGCCSSILRGMT